LAVTMLEQFVKPYLDSRKCFNQGTLPWYGEQDVLSTSPVTLALLAKAVNAIDRYCFPSVVDLSKPT